MSMISAQIDELRKDAEYYDGSEVASIMRYAADTIWQLRDDLQRANAENAELLEQMERLVTLLRVDCDIDASWDGLRRFWSIGLTENGCLMRDRACKAETDADRLRELVREVYVLHWRGLDCTECPWFDECDTDGGCPWLSIMHDRMHELGVEVDG